MAASIGRKSNSVSFALLNPSFGRSHSFHFILFFCCSFFSLFCLSLLTSLEQLWSCLYMGVCTNTTAGRGGAGWLFSKLFAKIQKVVHLLQPIRLTLQSPKVFYETFLSLSLSVIRLSLSAVATERILFSSETPPDNRSRKKRDEKKTSSPSSSRLECKSNSKLFD